MRDMKDINYSGTPELFNARRNLLKGIAGGMGISLAGQAASATSCFVKQPSDAFPYLLIDTHCHIFNAADIAVFKLVFGLSGAMERFPPVFRGPVAAVAKALAVEKSVAKEEKWLNRILKSKSELSINAQQQLVCEQGQVVTAIDDIEHFPPQKRLLAGYSRYRTENLVQMLKTFPAVDLFTPAMVDMFLGSGPARQNFVQLQPLYTRLTILSSGRMHPFVGFDPFRQASYDTAPKGVERGWSPLDRLKTAIQHQGFVGVKLYPPMGFSPAGDNAQRACGNKRANYQVGHLQDGTLRKSYGEAIDGALYELYRWCSEHDVPIMAHSNDSMHANNDCKSKKENPDPINSPSDWHSVIKKYPALRVNLGHFGGGIGEDYKPAKWASAIGKLMTDQATRNDADGTAIRSLFADIANYSGILDTSKTKEVRNAITQLYEKHPVLSKQLMYGSDWFMLEDPDKFGNVNSYPQRYDEVIPAAFKSQFFGLNAVEFLGLRTGRGNRARLDAFYKVNKMTEPAWMTKLEKG